MKNIFFRTSSLWASVLDMALGLVLTFWPGMSGTVFCWGIAAARLWAKIVSRRCYKASGSTLPNSSEFHYMAKYTTPLLPRINPETTYDLVISFLTPHQIGLSRVNARRRVAWIHTDYTNIWVDAKDGRCVYRCL